MNPTDDTETALAIGNTAIDEFYRDGQLERTQPGGTAFNVASWFAHHGFETVLCSTVGEDFPELTDVDTSLCEVVSAPSPRCRVTLNESSAPEDRTWVEGQFPYRSLGPVEERFDVVGLTSGRSEFATPFETVTAPTTGFALDPLVGTYPPDRLAAYLAGSDYLFVNRDERRVLTDRLDTETRDLPGNYALQGAVETSEQGVRLYEPGGSVSTTVLDSVENPADTTGAGDAFAAAFLVETARGADAETAIQSAHEAAVRTITSVGARPFPPELQ